MPGFPVAVGGPGQCMTAGPTDVCKVPAPPAPPVPTPFPNIAQNAMVNPTTCNPKVQVEHFPVIVVGSEIPLSNGDEAGVAGGVVSSKFIGACKPTLGSFKVFIGGKPVCHLTSLTQQNGMPANTVGQIMVAGQVRVMVL